MSESINHFEKRKSDHLKIALQAKTQADGQNGLDFVFLEQDAFPELNFDQVQISTEIWGKTFSAPFFISSMTAGNEVGYRINEILAKFSESKKILMGVGSQRRELVDPLAAKEWLQIRQSAPNALLVGNLGLTQLIDTPLLQIQKMIESLRAEALFIHTNPLQEVIQQEGTPHFLGGLKALEKLCKEISVPVIVKEVGCGFSMKNLKQLNSLGVFAVDVSGLGGTHWGRVEAYRQNEADLHHQVGMTFKNWGQSTAQVLCDAQTLAQSGELNYKIWASGGIRSGLDIAKCLSVGASQVGLARPWLEAILNKDLSIQKDAEIKLEALFEKLSYELRVAMFCTGSRDLAELAGKGRFQWQKN